MLQVAGMSAIFTPVTFRCGRSAHNRIALAPLTNQQSHDDLPQRLLGRDIWFWLECLPDWSANHWLTRLAALLRAHA